MNAFVLAMFSVTAALAGILLILGILSGRRRRALTSFLILLSILPACVMARGGNWPMDGSFVFIVPPGSDEAVARLLAEVPAGQETALVRLAPPGVPEEVGPAAALRWSQAAQRGSGKGRMMGASPVLSSNPGWLERVADVAAPDWLTRLRHNFAHPTVVIPIEGDYWKGIDPSTIEIARDRAAFERTGQRLLAVDTSSSTLAVGRLDVVINGNCIPGGWRSDDVSDRKKLEATDSR